MHCPMEHRNSELLVAYTAGELDQEAARALERHLEACPACHALAARQAAVWKALESWEAPPVSSDFDRRFYRRVREEVRWWERLWRPFRPMPVFQALPLAAAACMLLIASLILQRPGTVSPAPARGETVRVDQVERTLDDLELLRQFDVASHVEGAHSDTM
jgi:anti-sigma factor RsiW